MGSPLVLVLVCLAFLQLHARGATAWRPKEPMHNRFLPLPLNGSNFHLDKPYDLPAGSRHSYKGGVHKFWLLASDKPYSEASPSAARTEIRIRGYDYTGGVWQFKGQAYVPSGTSGVSIMEVYGANHTACSTLMLTVYDGALMYNRSQVLADDIYGQWFQVNVIHDVGAGRLTVYINRDLKLTVKVDHGWDSHYFRFGVHKQSYSSYFMESRWRRVRVLKLSGYN